MPVELGQKKIVTIEKISLGGDGIVRIKDSSNFVIFVPYTAPNDKVEILVTEKRKNFARGQVQRVLESNSLRTEPPCPYFFAPSKNEWCGGCNFQHLHYESQLQMKLDAFKETAAKIGGIDPNLILPVTGSVDHQWRYRNKMQVPFGVGKSGESVAGFFAPNSHRIVPINDCLIHPDAMMKLVQFVRGRMKEWKLAPYSEKNHSGWLRHLLIRRDMAGGKMLVIFVTRADFFPRRAEWIAQIQNQFPDIVGICQNINEECTNVILGKKWKKIFGRDFLFETLRGLGKNGDLKLKVSAGSFFQVNTAMAEKLYDQVRRFVQEKPGGHLLDLYCGVGGIALTCASFLDQVIGADETYSSIEDAKENMRLNQIANCRFHRVDVHAFLKEYRRTLNPSASLTIIVDPPRMGCAEEVLREIVKLKPVRIIYVSCEPSTLARDLKLIVSHGFAVRKIQPVDLFPQSAHVESVTLIERIQ